MIDWEHVVERLRTASGYWLATISAGNRPHVVPIWGVLVAGELYLETGDPNTAKNRNLAHSREVVVHLDGVDDAVIVFGTAEPFVPDPAQGAAIAAAMHAKYPDYEPAPDSWDQGGLFRIAPRTVHAWLEMPTATRWRFRAE
jgi:nitroimidazol reductase NimA-like FMN-containing flavoprotein (pyridoxamine 5'-phosphate oxidase superfamily)